MGTVRGGVTMLRKMGIMAREDLGLEDWFPPLVTYLLKYDMVIGMACVTLRMSLSKWRYFLHIQWDSMRKGPIEWDNLYGSGMGRFSRKLRAPQGDHGLENL